MKPETIVLDTLPCLTVTQLRRNGMLIPGRRWNGSAGWRMADGSVLMEADVAVNAESDSPYIRLSYVHDGTMMCEVIPLRLIPSNLQGCGGYYLFVCPVSGVQSRKLFFHDGRFVSRGATGRLYLSQHRLQADKVPESKAARDFEKYMSLSDGHRRKMTYRGRPTRYARTLERLMASGGCMIF